MGCHPNKPKTQKEWDEREEVCYPVFVKYANKLLEASEALDVEAVWKIANEIATEMINRVCCTSLPPTRGSPPEFRMTAFAQRAPCSKFHKKARKVASLLVELKKKPLQA